MVKGAWGDGPFDFAGDHYTITAYDGLPKPVQQPRPPIVVGGGGRKLLQLAGREADIVGINPILQRGRDRCGGGARHARRLDPAQGRLDPRGRGRAVRRARAPDPLLRRRDHRRRAGPGRRHGADVRRRRPTRRSASGSVLAGSVDEVCDTLVARREEWGVSYIVFGDDTYEQFAPVVARLAGT